VGLKDRRKVVRIGGSTAITLPPKLAKGKEASLAADRLILLDPRGELSEDDLLEFLETYVEPNLWEWLKKKK